MTSFRPYEPDQHLLLPPSLRDWLPPDHLAWFISETVDQLDLSDILATYRDGGQGNLPYHPAMMLKVLMYAYATGVFSSRRIARQIEENIAFRVLAAGNLPDHRTICRFREQHLATFLPSRPSAGSNASSASDSSVFAASVRSPASSI